MTKASRRTFLRVTLIGGALVVVLPAVGLGSWIWTTGGTTQGAVAFGRRLRIPELATGSMDPDGALRFDLPLTPGTSTLVPSKGFTEVWGIGGGYLGPTLRMRRGDRIRPVVSNGLPEPTTLHWHGMELPAKADGGPHSLIEVGAQWTPEWTVDQPAATLWYHPHPHGATRQHVYRGVAGMIIVDDDETPAGLPAVYGVDDVPLIVQDKNIRSDGTLDESGIDFGGLDVTGLLGSDILVNGTWGPVFTATTRTVRFRILNASNARIYDFRFSDDRAFHVVGSDAGLLPAPERVHHAMVSPGERLEVVVSFEPGDRVMLRSAPPDLGADLLTGRLAGDDDSFDILLVQAADRLAASPVLPKELSPSREDPPTGAERSFVALRVHDQRSCDGPRPYRSRSPAGRRRDVGRAQRSRHPT